MSNNSSTSKTAIFVACITVVFLTAVAVWFAHRNSHSVSPLAARPANLDRVAPAAWPLGQVPLTSLPPRQHPPAPAVAAAKAKPFESFQRRPFTAARKSGTDEWTTEDGRSPDVIRRLAHNEWELERMTAENDTITRRQLVYRDHPINEIVLQARSAGQTVQSFTLPAFDGQEYEVEVTQNNVEPVISAGSLSGHLKDHPNSIASIGFKDGYESYNILSPDDGIYIVADAREPGEVMVKEIIPGRYATPTQSNAPDFILPTR